MARRGRPTQPIVLSDDERETLERWARRPEERQRLGDTLSDRVGLRRRGDQSGGRRPARGAPEHGRQVAATVRASCVSTDCGMSPVLARRAR